MPNENVYLKYLGITTAGKPDHYTLLGVPFKEAKPDIIAAAARQRKEILSLQETPDNQAEIQLLISEIKDARDCLLDDKKRKQYEFDFLLNRSVEEKNAATGPQKMEPMPEPSASAIYPGPTPAAGPASDPFAFASAPPAHGPAPGANPFDFGSAPPAAGPGPAPASDPFGFASAPPAAAPGPAPASDPFGFASAPPAAAPGPAPVSDPFGFTSAPPAAAPGPAPASNPFGFTSAPPAAAPGPAPASNPFGFNSQPAPAPQQGNPYASAPPRSAGGYTGKSASHGKAQKKDNTPLIAAIAGGVVILLILLWNMGYNSPSKEAERLYNEAVTAVNSYRYDEAREKLDLAIRLDKQEKYVKYRASIDKKEKNHEYTMRHRAAQNADDDESAFPGWQNQQ